MEQALNSHNRPAAVHLLEEERLHKHQRHPPGAGKLDIHLDRLPLQRVLKQAVQCQL